MAFYKTSVGVAVLGTAHVNNKKVNIPVSNINHSLYVYIPSIYCNTRHVLTPQCILYRYFSGGVCRSKAMLLNNTVIITGANTVIGRERQLLI